MFGRNLAGSGPPGEKRPRGTYTSPARAVVSEIETSITLLDHLTVALAAARTSELPAAALQVLVAEPGITAAHLWLLDVAGNTLTDTGAPENRIPVDGTLEGAAAREGSPLVDGDCAHIPISVRGYVLGVLSVVGSDPAALVSRVASAATLLARELIASDRFGDSLGRFRHEDQLSVSATVQHTLLPLLDYRDDRVEVVGRLEPAYEVAGDLYDYAVNPEAVHLAIFDAVGHDLRSTTLSTLAVGAYRRGRRNDVLLSDVAVEIDETIASFDRRFDFVTGLLAQLDLSTGELHLSNAGHHEPLLVRDGEVRPLSSSRSSPPFGLGGPRASVDRFGVEPNDLIVFYTDGVIEARDADRRQWGLDRLRQVLLDRAAGKLDHLAKSVLDSVTAHVGPRLSDDAALLLVRASPDAPAHT